jgi:diguanylate cyclase (GGDEF)-like protein
MSWTAHVLVAVAGTIILAAVAVCARWCLVRRGISDGLTGLANRKLFESRLAHAQLRAHRHDFWVAVLAVDVDELATVNNTMGRECGDQLLRDVAGRLRRFARDEDTVARISSDEFAILLEQVDSPTGAARAARRILDSFQEPLMLDSRAVATSLSIGISVHQGGAAASEQLISEAGIALARAKARGKRRFETFEPPMGIEAAARLKLEAELQQAVIRDELQIHYQPIVDIGNGAVVGAEALARWAHPERGLLFPVDFIGAAESSGVIMPLGRYVLQEACQAAAGFDRLTGAAYGFGISVNVSSRQFRDSERLIADVEDALNDSGLKPERLTL